MKPIEDNLSWKLGVIDNAETEGKAAIEIPNTTDVTEEKDSQNDENIEANECGRNIKCMGQPVAMEFYENCTIDGESTVRVPVDRIIKQGQEFDKQSNKSKSVKLVEDVYFMKLIKQMQMKKLMKPMKQTRKHVIEAGKERLQSMWNLTTKISIDCMRMVLREMLTGDVYNIEILQGKKLT